MRIIYLLNGLESRSSGGTRVYRFRTRSSLCSVIHSISSTLVARNLSLWSFQQKLHRSRVISHESIKRSRPIYSGGRIFEHGGQSTRGGREKFENPPHCLGWSPEQWDHTRGIFTSGQREGSGRYKKVTKADSAESGGCRRQLSAARIRPGLLLSIFHGGSRKVH